MISKKTFDEALKEKYQQMIKAGEIPGAIVFGLIDAFGDSLLVECKRCRRKGFVRPWLYLLAKEHNIDVFVCLPCAIKDQPDQLKSDTVRYAATVESYAAKRSSKKRVRSRLMGFTI